MLKAKIDKAAFDALPEAVRAEYAEQNGSYVLTVEGMAPATEVAELRAKVAEFRDNNVALMKSKGELTDKLKAFDGITDPAKARDALAELAKIQGKGVKNADDLSKMVADAVSAAVKPLQDSLQSERTLREDAQKKADAATFRDLLHADATKAGVRETGFRHVLADAQSVFELKDGKLAPKAGVKHPTDPLKDLTPTEWLSGLRASDAYLFEESKGAGAGSPTGTPANPNARVIVSPDPRAFGEAAEDIAKGKAVVQIAG